jgi:hypothetical protein
LAEYYSLQLLLFAIKGLKTRKLVTSKPDRFTKQMFFKCRDTNLFATGMQPETTTVSNGIYGGDFSGGGSSGEF